jgi:hypothetical protein
MRVWPNWMSLMEGKQCFLWKHRDRYVNVCLHGLGFAGFCFLPTHTSLRQHPLTKTNLAYSCGCYAVRTLAGTTDTGLGGPTSPWRFNREDLALQPVCSMILPQQQQQQQQQQKQHTTTITTKRVQTILYYDQQMHNYFTNYHTPTCFDTIVSSSGRL